MREGAGQVQHGAHPIWMTTAGDGRQVASEAVPRENQGHARALRLEPVEEHRYVVLEDVIQAEVVAALRTSPALDSARIDWAPVGVGIAAEGNQGFTFGFMTQRLADGTSQPYKYLAYWQRGSDGWRAIAWKRGRRADGKIDLTPRPPLLPGAFPPEARGPALEQAERAFSDEAQTIGLGPAFAKYGTADSMNLGGAANAGFVFGAEAIAKLVSEGQPAGGSTLNWSADRVVVAASGDLGVSIGHIRFNERAEDGSERPPIPFFTVWRRAAPDQPWRYIAE